MALSLKVKKPENWHDVFQEAKSDATKHRIVFTGDEKSGSGFGYGFSGSYVVDDDFIEINVLKKPFPIPQGMIKKSVNNYCDELFSRNQTERR
jgi:hypothetical protein